MSDHHEQPPESQPRPGPPEGREPAPRRAGPGGRKILVIRPNSGLSGDMMAAGLLALAGAGAEELDQMLRALKLDQLPGRVALESRQVNQVAGVGLRVDLPEEHEHRNLRDIENFFSRTDLSPGALDIARKSFRLLAEAEGAVHGLSPEEVHFHEVGALDSLLDIGLAALLLDRLAPDRFICGPLPVCDGVIRCRHGLIPSPAPAVLRLLVGVPVVGLASRGETVTPTGLALLKGAGAEFGPWPPLTLERQALAYGSRLLEGVPNGAIFAWGLEP
ncbi:MAG: LarC family nickel insertion protein [Candidatus Adiutrix sp.]|nr:LarC family nickel insertion protein [Candidatus Adiutrix sp.]